MAFHAKAFSTGTTSGSLVVTSCTTSKGDDVYCLVSTDSTGAATFTAPAGWAAVGAVQQSTFDGQSVQLFNYTANNGQGAPAVFPGTFTWTWSGTTDTANSAVMFSLSGRAVGSMSFVTQSSLGTSSTPPFNAVMAGGTALAGDDLICLIATDPSVPVGTVTASATWGGVGAFVNQGATAGGASAAPMALSTLDGIAAGATGSITDAWTDTGSTTTSWMGWVLAVKKAGSYWTRIQGKSATGLTTSPLASGAFAIPVHDLSLLVVTVTWTSTGAVTAGQDGLGNTIANNGIVLVSGPTTGTSNQKLAVYAVLNATAGAPNFSFTIGGTITSGAVLAEEYYCASGPVTSFRNVAGNGGGTGTTGAPTSGAVTAQPGDLEYAGCINLGSITGPGGGYSIRTTGGDWCDEDNLNSPGGSRTATFTQAASGNWICNLAVFAPSPTGPLRTQVRVPGFPLGAPLPGIATLGMGLLRPPVVFPDPRLPPPRLQTQVRVKGFPPNAPIPGIPRLGLGILQNPQPTTVNTNSFAAVLIAAAAMVDAITMTKGMISPIVGDAITVDPLSINKAFADVILGHVIETDALGVSRAYADAISARATETDAITMTRGLVDAIHGASIVTAQSPAVARAIADAILAAAIVVAPLGISRSFSDTISGHVSAVDALVIARGLVDAISGHATESASLGANRAISDVMAGHAAMAATLGAGLLDFALAIAGHGSTAETMVVLRGLVDAVAAHAGVTDAITRATTLAAAVHASTVLAQQLSLARVFGAVVTTNTAVSATLQGPFRGLPWPFPFPVPVPR